MSAHRSLGVPPGGAARLYILPPHGNIVLLAATADDASPAALYRPGHLSVLVVHDKGDTWPDAAGIALSNAVLAEGGTVALKFDTLGDALACRRRLEGGR